MPSKRTRRARALKTARRLRFPLLTGAATGLMGMINLSLPNTDRMIYIAGAAVAASFLADSGTFKKIDLNWKIFGQDT